MRSLLYRAIDRLIVYPPAAERTAWLKDWTYAHRGLHGPLIPENTLVGFAAAVEAGLGVECDIQRSSDGQAMVFHDWELDRLTDETGAFGLRDAAILETARYKGQDYGIARLSQLLELVAGRAPILIEIKSKPRFDVKASCAAVASALERYRGLHAVMSFDPRAVRWFHRHSPDTLAGLVMREDEIGFTQKPWQRHLALWLARPDFLAYHVQALPNRMVSRLRKRGMVVPTWTVDSPKAVEIACHYADTQIAEGGGLPGLGL